MNGLANSSWLVISFLASVDPGFLRQSWLLGEKWTYGLRVIEMVTDIWQSLIGNTAENWMLGIIYSYGY